MTSFSEKIISENMIRFGARRKGRFRLALKAGFEELGYHPRMEIHPFWGKNRNVIVGDLSKAKVIFTAHYDTAPKLFLPNFIMPRNVLFTVLYQLFLGLLVLVGVFAFSFAGGFLGMWISIFLAVTDETALAFTGIGGYFCMFLFIYLVLGIPNRNNYNDNTSGVVTLTEIAAKLPENLRDRAAFVFFDREEWGTLGSLGFKMSYAKLLANKPVVNFDCVGDGETLAFLLREAVGEEIKEKLIAADNQTRKVVFFPSKTTFYPSDHANFKRGIGVAAFRKNRIFGYYLGRIHTGRDRILNEENISSLSELMVRFLEMMR